MIYVVTGAAGFIGANVIAALNLRGHTDVIAVDQVTPDEARNLAQLKFRDYIPAEDFLAHLEGDAFSRGIQAIFHEGACSSTVERDEQFMFKNNYEYSQRLLNYCFQHKIICQYASSAGVYGHRRDSEELPANEAPLTVYAQSKLMTDNYLRTLGAGNNRHRIAGLRYFNVYGPGEGHKGFMRSTPLVFHEQLKRDKRIKVFGDNDVCAAGEHRRDFIHIDDVIKVKLWLAEHPQAGIYNLGTGQSRTFMDVAKQVVAYHGYGAIDYTPFPEELKPYYQNYTEANLQRLRLTGYTDEFMPLDEGVPAYLEWLSQNTSAAL